MSTKKTSIKETTPTPVVGGGNGDGVANKGEEQKPPTFEEMWFDDPIEGREAQRLALKLRNNVVLRAEPMRIYLCHTLHADVFFGHNFCVLAPNDTTFAWKERTGIVPMLLQGLHHLEKARPIDPAEWLAAFLLKNNPRRDMIITPPILKDPNLSEPHEAAPTTEPTIQPKVDGKKK